MRFTKTMRVTSVRGDPVFTLVADGKHKPAYAQLVIEASTQSGDECITYRAAIKDQPWVGEEIEVHIVQQPEDGLGT